MLAKVFTPEGKEVGTVRQNAALRLRPADADAEFDVLTVNVTVQLTDAHGAAVTARTDAIAAGAFTPRRPADYTYELPVARLAPGTYLVTIEAGLGSITARRDVRFSVR